MSVTPSLGHADCDTTYAPSVRRPHAAPVRGDPHAVVQAEDSRPGGAAGAEQTSGTRQGLRKRSEGAKESHCPHTMGLSKACQSGQQASSWKDGQRPIGGRGRPPHPLLLL